MTVHHTEGSSRFTTGDALEFLAMLFVALLSAHYH